ncbi:hypothetical protein [Fibrella forsythiae]|uniref:Outer membrane protein transport protein (OMPP1/FadL/TodX) n=1 Tax=Fibrella forsythiae TaxID=2817061 RepID=A0ABS3JAP4_9BACT|nr:hypothetical protein [Fibrella forsythiae]MBO0947050.1 hypothetical protein [Fibrella forsythiae]
MKRFLAGLLLALPTSSLLAQGSAAEYADDAFRYNDFVQQGSARFRGVGGNQVALGGDASNIAGNPAGLGFYNRSEITFSPSINLTSARSGFLGSTVDASKTNFNIGQLSLVFAGEPSRNSRWRRSSFGISYSQSLNFSSTSDAQGRNNNTNSTFLNEYIPGLNSGAPGSVKERALSDDFTVNTARTPEAALYGLFLVNPTVYGATSTNPNGTIDTNGSPFYRLDPTLPLNQRATSNQSGANSQWTFAYGSNFDDKLYLGISANISRIRYDSENTIREAPVNGQFDNYGRTNNLAVTGTGFGLTVGAIYRPVQSFQIGASASSPTFFSMKETFQQTFFAFGRSSQLVRDLTVNSVAVDPNDFNYSMTTPFRASGGFTYFLGGGKLGFLTATADYVGYGGMRIGTDAFNSTQSNTDFKNDVTSEVKNTYQNVVNVRAGAEIRANMFRIRGGVAYLPSAYRIDLDRVSADSRSRVLFSGGVGVRTDRFSFDLSGSYYNQKTGLSPYILSDSDTPTVSTTTQRVNAMASVGFFF